jgi:peptide-methionine (S)-S-oxide reductase
MKRQVSIVIASILAVGAARGVCESIVGGGGIVGTDLSKIKTDRLFEEGYVPERVETASFAMGCFWGPDGLFGVLPGVIRTRVGYAGGTTEAPSYDAIGDHAEAIQIDFDPSLVTYGELLEVFWANHAADVGPYAAQYRPIVLYHTEEQRAAAEAFVARAAAERGARPAAPVAPVGVFTRAEDDHQKHRLQSTPRLADVVAELVARFGSFDAAVDSTVAARLNGYASSWAPRERLEQEIDAYGLSDGARAAVLMTVR